MTLVTSPTKRGSQFQSLLIGVAFLVLSVVFVLSSGHWFKAFLAVHVLFVAIWIGGGAALMILGIVAETKSDGAQLAAIAKQAAFLGQRVFAPAAIVVVVMGGAMVENGHIGYNHFWIGFGVVGFISSFAIGVAVLSPMSAALAKLLAEKGSEAPESKAAVSKILLISRVDVAVLLLVIVDMVAKPFS